MNDLRHMARLGRLLCISLLVPIGLACATPLPTRPSQAIARGDLSYLSERIDWETANALDEGAASLTIALFDENGVFWEKGYGLADVENGVAARPETLYRVGSISKLITAIAVMQLAAQGLIELDAPLVKYLPEFEIGPPPPFLPGADTWKLTDITIRSMLTHHSGIPSDIFRGFFSEDPVHYTDVVEVLRGWKAQAPVGLVHSYSNVAMTLLGHVVARVSGDDFPRYAKERILAPSGMTVSSFVSTPEIERTVARSYVKGEEIDPMKIGSTPAGGLFSSARELAIFGQMALRGGIGSGGQILSSEDLGAMWQRQNTAVALDGSLEMGIGWFRDSTGAAVPGGGFSVGHSGGMLAHRSFLLLLPETNLGVAVLTNSAEGGGAAQELVFLALRLALEARRAVPFKEWEPNPPRLADAVDPETLARLAGSYATQVTAIDLTHRGGGLRTQRFAYFTSAELRPAIDGSFRPRLRLLGWLPLEPEELSRFQLRFRRVGSIDAVYLDPERGPEMFLGWRVEPSPATPAWRERLGRYRIVNGAGDHFFFEEVELRVEHGRLVLALDLIDDPTPTRRYLEPLNDEEACDWALGRSGGTRLFARIVDGKTELELLGYRLQAIDD